jgi:hypothetical protein
MSRPNLLPSISLILIENHSAGALQNLDAMIADIAVAGLDDGQLGPPASLAAHRASELQHRSFRQSASADLMA